MTARYQERVDSLVRLMEHPNTIPSERSAAQAAYARLTGKPYPRTQPKQKAPKQKAIRKYWYGYDYKTLIERDLLFKCAQFVIRESITWRQVESRKKVQLRLTPAQGKTLDALYERRRSDLEHRMLAHADRVIKEWFG